MHRSVKIILPFLLVIVCALIVRSDPVITVEDDGRGYQIGATASLTEATAKRLMGPVSTIATTQIIAASSGASGVPARANRMRIALENISSENVWYSGTSPATATNSVLIAAGASTGMLYNGPLFFYSVSGNATVCISEGYNP